MPAYQTRPGRAHPLGAHAAADGVNFSLYTGLDATSVELLLFDSHTAAAPSQVIPLDPMTNKTFYFWHIFVEGLKPGAVYGYRVSGPGNPYARGQRYDRDKVLVDPYSLGNTSAVWNRAVACRPGDNVATCMRSIVVDNSGYDWEGDSPINRPLTDTVIYEMHVRGFTKSPTSRCKHPGTFSGIVEKIPYLKELGITAVELLPVFGFDENEIDRISPVTGKRLVNYWGYSPIGFFDPHDHYCISPEQAGHANEFRDMVKALHKAGIEVILDVVFNHTGEDDEMGPTISFRGLDNSTYYLLDPENPARYLNYSGCGNTLNCNHPLTMEMIIDCLEYWMNEMHVDGFRFDLGSVLTRGEDGQPMKRPPLVWHIELSDVLASTKIIAEAWDAGGLYQIGDFPGNRWTEWNGPYRDNIRRFVKGDPGLTGIAASRIAGSSDLYEKTGEKPTNSINFITCHDGFTLHDLVAYNFKHNRANGESNRDGADYNESWNCGAEGETDNPRVNQLRRQQIKNFATILLLSQGVPMICGGDEGGRTQQGNNNAYCQDNEISWFDWDRLERNRDIFRFFQQMTAFRGRYPTLRRTDFFKEETSTRGLKDITWHGCRLFAPGWDDPASRVLAFTIGGFNGDPDFHVMLNMDSKDLTFQVPQVAGMRWHLAVNTAAPSPRDIFESGREPKAPGNTRRVTAHSSVVLISKPDV